LKGHAVLTSLLLVALALVVSMHDTTRNALTPNSVHAQNRSQDGSSAQDNESGPGAESTKAAYSNASLKGEYGFALSNTLDDNSSSFIGSYTVDGLGHIKSGTIQVSTEWGSKNPICTLSVSGGTYTVESNGSGKMTLNINQKPEPCGGLGVGFCANGTYLIRVAQQGAAVAVAGNNEGCQAVGGGEISNFFALNGFRE